MLVSVFVVDCYAGYFCDFFSFHWLSLSLLSRLSVLIVPFHSGDHTTNKFRPPYQGSTNLNYSSNSSLLLQFCMLDYYLRCPHPQLMLPPDQVRDYLGSLSPSEIAECVSVLYPSLSSSVIDAPIPAAHVLSLPRKPVSMVDHLVHRLEAHWRLAYVVPRLLRWLLTLIQPIPTNPLGRSVSFWKRNTELFLSPVWLFYVFNRSLCTLAKSSTKNTILYYRLMNSFV